MAVEAVMTEVDALRFILDRSCANPWPTDSGDKKEMVIRLHCDEITIIGKKNLDGSWSIFNMESQMHP